MTSRLGESGTIVVCSSLMASDVEHTFMCLSVSHCISSLELPLTW